MTSREDCEKWLKQQGWMGEVGDHFLTEVLHQFSKTTIGHFPAEKEKQKVFEL